MIIQDTINPAWSDPKLPGFSACIRLRNESQFMVHSVLSWMQHTDEVVLLTQPSKDDTTKLADQLEAEYPDKIKHYHYPYVVHWIDTPGFYSGDPTWPGHLVHMSNTALSCCRYAWTVKVEGDVIAIPSVARLISQIRDHPDHDHYYGLVVLNVAGEHCDQISATVPRNGGLDEAIFQTKPGYHFIRSGKWEMIDLAGKSASTWGWGGLHMKRCKTGMVGWNGEAYTEFEPAAVRSALQAFNASNPYPGQDDPGGVPELFYKEWQHGII